MGARTTRKGHRCRELSRFAAGLLLFGLAQASAAQSAPAKPEPAPRSAIVNYEEKRNAHILYFEESGGLLSRTASPDARETRPAAKAPATPAPAAAEKTASADARLAAKRRASASDVMAARP